jgi:hypothetical protein
METSRAKETLKKEKSKPKEAWETPKLSELSIDRNTDHGIGLTSDTTASFAS